MKSFKKSSLFLAFFAASAGLFLFQNFTAYTGGQMANIDMENGTKIEIRDAYNQLTNQPEKRPYLIQQVPAYREFATTQDTGTVFNFWASPSQHYPDSKEPSYGLGFLVEPDSRVSTPENHYKSKIELNVAKFNDTELDAQFNGHYILHNNDTVPKYLGFAFKMDATKYETPIRWALHMQVWQCCAGIQPPLVFQVVPKEKNDAGDVKFVVIKRNDDHLGSSSSTNGVPLTFSDNNNFRFLKKGVWHKIVFRFIPDPGERNSENVLISSSGHIAMWINGEKVIDHKGPWGFTPGGDILDRYSVKLGIYRGVPNNRQQFYFDNIRWATTYCGADPAPDQTTCP